MRFEIAMAALLLLAGPARAQDGPEVVRVGHWLEVRGELGPDGVFRASRVELIRAEDYEVLVGTVPEDETDPARFRLLGQEIHVSPKTEWNDVDRGSLPGARVKVEGRYRGPRNFSAREISGRGPGRERIAGRVDEVYGTDEGVEVRIMRFTVLLPADIEIEHEEPLESIPLIPPRFSPQADVERDEEDIFGAGIRLAEDLYLTGQIEGRTTFEDNFDLDDDDAEDRSDYELSLRARMVWEPTEAFAAVGTVRHLQRYRVDEEDGHDMDGATTVGETYGFWWNALDLGVDLQVGRQDFDERREWLYDQNLDALRLIASRPDWRLELSLSTTLADGSERDEESLNAIAYLSNNDRRRHLAAYAVHRDIDAPIEETPTHLGARALGSWLPENKLWADAAYLVGEREDTRLRGAGFDVGTTWSPGFAQPLNFTVGYAFGNGDNDPGGDSDHTFRQTGFQDNNDKFAGVTSFRYYGELFDPELANLQVITAGIGARIAERTSLDLVYHHFRQDEASTLIYGGELDQKPNGLSPTLGYEVDLILGSRRWESWDLELVGGWFHPGDAFDDDDDAYLAKLQLRYRF